VFGNEVHSSLVRITEKLLGSKSGGSGIENRD
jgi:hypothetical protein